MIAALDVQYEAHAAVTAALAFGAWIDAAAAFEQVTRSPGDPAPYQPGAFFRRELPYLLAAVARLERVHPIEVVVVDGHAWLGEGRPGLGARLFEALEGRVAVIGVAKSAFAGGDAIPVLRGTSKRPLHVSAAGLDARRAAALVRGMHGPHRLPTLLERVDELARGHAVPGAP